MGFSAGKRAPPRTESRQKKARNDLSTSTSRGRDDVRARPKMRILEDQRREHSPWKLYSQGL